MTASDARTVTPGEVDAIQFTVVNRHFGRPGYLESEVDDFLDRVAETIADQAREIDRLGVLLEQRVTVDYGGGPTDTFLGSTS